MVCYNRSTASIFDHPTPQGYSCSKSLQNYQYNSEQLRVTHAMHATHATNKQMQQQHKQGKCTHFTGLYAQTQLHMALVHCIVSHWALHWLLHWILHWALYCYYGHSTEQIWNHLQGIHIHVGLISRVSYQEKNKVTRDSWQTYPRQEL